MKQRGKVLGGLATVLLAASAMAITSSESPYSGIPIRNVFGLRPPPEPVQTNAVSTPPAVKIVLTGVTTILGKKMVLFKTQGSGKPGQPVVEQSHIMKVGDQEAGIEVLEIDEWAGAIKFKNQDTVVTLTMDKDAAKLPNTPPTAAPPVAGVPGAPGAPAGPTTVGFAPQGGTPGAPGVTSFGNPAAGGNTALQSIPTRSLRTSGANNYGGGPSFGMAPGYNQNPAAQQPTLSPEEQMIRMELEREMYKNNPRYPPPPPTPITPGGGQQQPPSFPGGFPPPPR